MNILQKVTRSEAYKLAWEIRKTGVAFGKAISQAWQTLKLKIRLAATDEKGEWISFRKEGGEVRNALATRNSQHIPDAVKPKTGNEKPEKLLVVKYYDILADGWRSFRADRLIIN
jgi:hypothetical protein